MYWLAAAANRRVELKIELATRLEANRNKIGVDLKRELRLAEISLQLKADQRRFTFGKDGLSLEDEEDFILRLQMALTKAAELKSKEVKNLMDELNRHRDGARAHARSIERREQGRQQSGDEREYRDPEQDSKLEDVAPDALKLTGTEG